VSAAWSTPSDVGAFFRDGQVFITWTEDSSAQYDIYRHTSAITSGTVSSAVRIATVGDKSSNTLYGIGAPINQTNWIIQPKTSGTGLGSQLTNSQGLFVHTTKETSGDFFYAVTTGGGTTISGNTSGPVSEKKMGIKPIPIYRLEADGAVHIHYSFFMDWSMWNPAWTGYIYNFLVKLPKGWSATGAAMPIVHNLEGHTTRLPAQFSNDNSPGPNIYVRNESVAKNNAEHQDWYYGHFNRTRDSIGNYTEYRIILSLLYVTRYLNGDSARIFGYGHSMGGSGTLTLGVRYPSIFSSVYCSQPATDFGNTAFVYHSNVTYSYGTKEQNLPVVNLPFNDPARPQLDRLQAYNGTPVFTWQNTRQQLISRAGDETALICLSHGQADGAIDWATQGAPFQPVILESRRAFKYVANDATHNWQGFNAVNWDLQFASYGEWNAYKLRVDESMPGFSGIESSNSLRDAVWSVISDKTDIWEMSLSGVGEVCNITPRRCQAFYAKPGDRFDLFVDNVLKASNVTADSVGLVTGINIDFRSAKTVKFINTYRITTAIQAAPASGDEPQVRVFRNFGNSSVRIVLKGDCFEKLLLYNINGKIIADLSSAISRTAPAEQTVHLDISSLPSGAYLIKAGRGSRILTGKLVHMR
jgi:hypothetical protein